MDLVSDRADGGGGFGAGAGGSGSGGQSGSGSGGTLGDSGAAESAHPEADAADASTVDSARDTPADAVAGEDVDANGDAASACTTLAPIRALIADFNDSSNQAFGTPIRDPLYGTVYIIDRLIESASSQNWHITGFAQGLTFFGIGWVCTGYPPASCVLDVSSFAGIQFTIKGTLGVGHTLNFFLGRANNDPSDPRQPCSSCSLNPDADLQSQCQDPYVSVDLTGNETTPRTVTLLWSDFANGLPNDSLDPHQVSSIIWQFPARPMTDAGAYQPVDLTIDDIQFVPRP